MAESKDALTKMITLSYTELEKMFPKGSNDPEVIDLLRKKRAETIKPSEGGVIGYDGSVISKKAFDAMTPAQKRGFLVGPTCLHYNSGVPGMDDIDIDHSKD